MILYASRRARFSSLVSSATEPSWIAPPELSFQKWEQIGRICVAADALIEGELVYDAVR
jgi:hypothetical protein